MKTLSKTIILTSAATSLLFAATTVHAQSTGPQKVYLGAGAGVADFEDQVEVEDIGDVDLDDDSTAFKVFGGYRATENFAIEGGYRSFGEAEAGPFTIETDGLDVAGVGLLPLGPVDLFAKGGAIFWETDGGGGFPDDDGTDLMYGVGGQVNLGSLLLRLESEWFEFDLPEDTQMISASVGWTF